MYEGLGTILRRPAGADDLLILGEELDGDPADDYGAFGWREMADGYSRAIGASPSVRGQDQEGGNDAAYAEAKASVDGMSISCGGCVPPRSADVIAAHSPRTRAPTRFDTSFERATFMHSPLRRCSAMATPADLTGTKSGFLDITDAEIVHGPDVIADKVSEALRDADRFDMPTVKPPLSDALREVKHARCSSASEGEPEEQNALAGKTAEVDDKAGSAEVLKPSEDSAT